MKMLIMVMVYARDPQSALDAARKVVNEKIESSDLGMPFSFYVDFTKDALPELSGVDLRGSIPPVIQVSTARFPTDDKRGLEFVNSAMEMNREDFKKIMANIRYHIANYTDDQLFERIGGKGRVEIDGVKLYDNPFMFRYSCGEASGYLKEQSHNLYDFEGQPVSSPLHLQRILNESDSNPFYHEYEEQDPNWGRHIWNQPLWMVPFDAHYHPNGLGSRQ